MHKRRNKFRRKVKQARTNVRRFRIYKKLRMLTLARMFRSISAIWKAKRKGMKKLLIALVVLVAIGSLIAMAIGILEILKLEVRPRNVILTIANIIVYGGLITITVIGTYDRLKYGE